MNYGPEAVNAVQSARVMAYMRAGEPSLPGDQRQTGK
ncbi:hypothetical protein EDD27_7855 [Nonomuraea polychroma]|uniref:Uncharacterized protein n=1 Tax=Nonomuraea polychroma TaxID=46176 RepID=A0A438MHN5_9ACTN|nr:hypothetical protein EDD27_7855 [Nonomuraea polychroma]